MQPDETKTVKVNFEFKGTATTPDWAVTAWGESGSVQVRHSDPSESTQHFPHIKADRTIVSGPSPILPDNDLNGNCVNYCDVNDDQVPEDEE